MAESDSNDDKSFEPTQKKLDDARRKGDVAKSNDLHGAAVLGTLILGVFFVGKDFLLGSAFQLQILLERSTEVSDTVFNGSATSLIGQMALEHVPTLLTVFGLPTLAVLLSAIAQRSVTFSPEKILPKLNRISPIANAKNKYGMSGIFEFFKSLVKLVLFSSALAWFLLAELPEMIALTRLHPVQSTTYFLEGLLFLLTLVFLLSILVGAVDFLFQVYDHKQKLRMSRKEILDEAKENDGDPHQKQERTKKGRQITSGMSLIDVHTADVVVTNPTHFAIALRWSREPSSAPICVAKGVDELAMSIRNLAIEHGVPIHEDPPTARSLYSTTKIGEEVPVELYQAVAAAIRFSDSLRARKKSYA